MRVKEPGTPFEWILPDAETDALTGAIIFAINPRAMEMKPVKDIFKPMTTIERLLNKEDK